MSDILGEDFLEQLRGVRSPTSMNFSAGNELDQINRFLLPNSLSIPRKISKKLQKKGQRLVKIL